jgi:cupredoxin-like protein
LPISSVFVLRLLISAALAQELPSVTLTMRAGRLIPPTLEVPANTRFKIVIRNDGPGPAEFESRSLRKEKVLAPGASSFVVVAPLKPGSYDMFDEFHPDTSRGQIVAR